MDAMLESLKTGGLGGRRQSLRKNRKNIWLTKFIKLNMPDNAFFGNNNVYIGEYGVPENQYSASQISAVMSNTVNAGVAESCPYIIYWQLYDNELVNPAAPLPVTSNYDVRGFWLIRPDGSQSAHYNYLYNLCN
jgi:hypothetical protein